uniref:Alpha-type protein kinase domain-containing protein n=1 Tax=Paramoeba aestuarina TaxID=180227 RepID=A0A6U2Y647_9EUKA|mmetsp:Transcript_2110/g.3295  ORF Transcript_2110/g.3295 Transcript_2110/m.3295 type:complete len:467 (+) Transcript_2110:208-1608(+)|eukprot:CAMPEP_0201527750 /NCGR_PEP_ID=MMETSP0161_2-20130828/36209_1 /ASSEMBLY_ACC=CAM_ASM_000251 /TAXON_ID=180227 /ORGANISM="Neoparamoeba aestuarina, Strain SoJaBio B1-5/56/2" /LENGTH=466 /DNA_ID=CAMNT_0047928703 /DNA_START=203 /DNA_END=1603 /DNA_ORIENTATION=+
MSAGSVSQDPSWIKLNNLKELYEHGFITKEEFEERKAQIVDELTGTSSVTSSVTQSSVSNSHSRPSVTSHSRTRRRDIPKSASYLADQSYTATTEQSYTFDSDSKVAGKYLDDEVAVVARPPPDFNDIPLEKAVNHVFDPEKRKWTQRDVWVKIEGEPFAKGSMRLAFHSLIIYNPTPAQLKRSESQKLAQSPYQRSSKELQGALEDPEEETSNPPETNVLKMSIDPFEDKDTPFRDVETQMYSKQWAKRFNRYDPPKGIDFIACSILELIERPKRPICTVEQFITGPYRKHNNNYGYVSEDERNTPQAFSHFTYHASNGTMLICDIQGVGDLYTDPQIHTLNLLQQKGMTGFGGRGNLGTKGFERFLRSHRCNAICKYLRLPPVNAKEGSDDKGTLPSAPVMQYGHVDIVNVHISSRGGSNESTPLMSKVTDEISEDPVQSQQDREKELLLRKREEERICLCNIL